LPYNVISFQKPLDFLAHPVEDISVGVHFIWCL